MNQNRVALMLLAVGDSSSHQRGDQYVAKLLYSLPAPQPTTSVAGESPWHWRVVR